MHSHNTFPLNIEPGIRIGPVYLGQLRADVYDAISNQRRTFRRGGFELTDQFVHTGLQVVYDDKELVVFIEATKPGNPTFRGHQLLGLSLTEVVKLFAQLGHSPNYDDVGCRFEGVEIVLYAPFGKVESVGIYQEGYYDD